MIKADTVQLKNPIVVDANIQNRVELCFTQPKRYEFDMNKVQTIEDIKAVLEALMFSFTDDYPKFESIKHLVKKVG